MSLSIGIVGLPNVGKSTLFNAVLGAAQAAAESYPFCTIEPNVGVVPVPDARRQIAEEVSRARAELKAQVVDLAIDAAGRLIQANLDDKAQRKLVEDYIAELPGERVS